MVPHRSTTPAQTCLTSLFGWEAVAHGDMVACCERDGGRSSYIDRNFRLWRVVLGPALTTIVSCSQCLHCHHDEIKLVGGQLAALG